MVEGALGALAANEQEKLLEIAGNSGMDGFDTGNLAGDPWRRRRISDTSLRMSSVECSTCKSLQTQCTENNTRHQNVSNK